MYDVIVIGGGPAGLTAAIYVCRAGKRALVIEKDAFGGQIAQSPRVENYPGFAAISGTELADRMLSQAMGQGAEIELEEVVALRADNATKTVVCASGAQFESKAVIVASGAKPRRLGLAKEDTLSGVSYCAVCDGAFYKNRVVAVIGGGNSALQDALLLSEACRQVFLIHRRDQFRGEPTLVTALEKRGNVDMLRNAQIRELLGNNELTGVVVEQEGRLRDLTLDGAFVAIGRQPDLNIFVPFLALDDNGYAKASEDCRTSAAGIFVAGDCRQKSVRQLATAVADGASAALSAVEWLDHL